MQFFDFLISYQFSKYLVSGHFRMQDSCAPHVLHGGHWNSWDSDLDTPSLESVQKIPF